MKKILSILALAFVCIGLASCGGLEDEFLDNSYVYIADQKGETSTIVKDDKLYNPHTLFVTLSTSKTDLDAPVEVYYEAIPQGLVEGVDYEIKTETRSPLKFSNGDTVKLLKIVWKYQTPNEGTLTIKLTGSNLSYLKMGYPKMNFSSTYVYTKKSTGN